MRTKDEAFKFVRDLILSLKIELPQAMWAIRNDNGTELKNARFDTFCSDQGLEHQYSSPLHSIAEWSCRTEELDAG